MEVRNIQVAAMFMENRFEPDLDVLNKFGSFQKKYKATFPKITHQHNKAFLRANFPEESESERSLYLSPINMGMIYNPCTDKDEFVKEALGFLDFIKAEVDFSHFLRCGMRSNLIIPVKDLEREMADFAQKLLGKNAFKQLGTTLGEFTLNLVTNAEDVEYRLGFSFVERDKENEKLPKHGLLIDVDASKENLSIEEAYGFIKNAHRLSILRVQNILSNFITRSIK